MSFTHSAFIRKNTPELIEKLRDLGLNFYAVTNGYYLLVQHGEVFGLLSETTLEYLKNKGVIDSGTNEDLFLALAALRDDSDYMQWFTDGKEFILCDREDWGDMISSLCSAGRYNYDKNWELSNKFKKATINELIEHFKDKS